MKHLLAAALAALTAACSSDPYCRFAPGAADLCGPVQSQSVRLVCVGESHDQRSHHELELATLEAMAKTRAPLLLGMEMFQRPFQGVLDDYVSGRIDEKTMLRGTEYFTRWNFDFTFYAPLWRFAREHRIRVVALNADSALITKIRKGTGLSGLSSEERWQLAADIDLTDAVHRARVEATFKAVGHPLTDPWYEAMTSWDETMAESAVLAMEAAGPDSRMLIVAGRGHCEATGIPDRVLRRLPGIERVLILADTADTARPKVERDGEAFVVTYPPRDQPPAPKFGVAYDPAPDGEGLLVKAVVDGGAAAKAGIAVGDVVLSLDGEPVRDTTDLRWFIDTHRVGDVVAVGIRRADESLSVSVTLAPAPAPAPAPAAKP